MRQPPHTIDARVFLAGRLSCIWAGVSVLSGDALITRCTREVSRRGVERPETRGHGDQQRDGRVEMLKNAGMMDAIVLVVCNDVYYVFDAALCSVP